MAFTNYALSILDDDQILICAHPDDEADPDEPGYTTILCIYDRSGLVSKRGFDGGDVVGAYGVDGRHMMLTRLGILVDLETLEIVEEAIGPVGSIYNGTARAGDAIFAYGGNNLLLKLGPEGFVRVPGFDPLPPPDVTDMQAFGHWALAQRQIYDVIIDAAGTCRIAASGGAILTTDGSEKIAEGASDLHLADLAVSEDAVFAVAGKPRSAVLKLELGVLTILAASPLDHLATTSIGYLDQQIYVGDEGETGGLFRLETSGLVRVHNKIGSVVAIASALGGLVVVDKTFVWIMEGSDVRTL